MDEQKATLQLRIYLLGGARAIHAGVPLGFPRRRAMALLALLAQCAWPLRRESVIELLWPDAGLDRGFAYLRNILWILRRSPVGRYIDDSSGSLSLQEDGRLWIDTRRLRFLLGKAGMESPGGGPPALNAIPLLEEAAALGGAPFLAGFTCGDSEPFDAWRDAQDDQIRRSVTRVLERLVRFHASRRSFETAINHAHRWLILEPWDEAALRHLMVLYARSGRRSGALRLYFDFARQLKKDLGVHPEDETVRLLHQLRAGDFGGARHRAEINAPAHNLPNPTTPFFGRQAELESIRELLTHEGCRLLTLTGLGGSGKTRMAIAAAAEQVGAFEDGVVFVPLVAVESYEFVAPAILDVLRVPDAGGAQVLGSRGRGRGGTEPGWRGIQEHLRNRQLLLVLDNLEHVLDAAQGIGRVLASAPGIRILATSRVPLGLRGEHVLEIGGLPIPGSTEGPDVVASFPSVRLFIESARRAQVGFLPEESDLRAIAKICRAVDGIPLGIELAATWIRVLSCAGIAREIEKGLDLLVSAERDVVTRHRSLRAVFEQSEELLGPASAACFRRLAVFNGAFGLDAARAVTGCNLESLSELADKSLLGRTATGGFEMIDLIRQHAGDRLARSPRDRASTFTRHTEYYVGMLEKAAGRLRGPDQPRALEDLKAEADNLRSAWRRIVQTRQISDLQRAALGYFLFHDILSRFSEGSEVFREGADAVSGALVDRTAIPGDAALQELFRAFEGWFMRFADPCECATKIEEASDRLEDLPYCWESSVVAVLRVNAYRRAVPASLMPSLQRALEFHRLAEDEWGMALTLDSMSFLASASSPDDAEEYARRCLAGFRRIRDPWGISLALFALGRSADAKGRPAEARRYLEDSIALRQSLGPDVDIDGIVLCLQTLGTGCLRSGDIESGRDFHQRAVELCIKAGRRMRAGASLSYLGLIAWWVGEVTTARHLLDEALLTQEEFNDEDFLPFTSALLGHVALSMGHIREAQGTFDRYPDGVIDSSWLILGKARVAFLQGDRERARALFTDFVARPQDRRNILLLLEALIDLGESGMVSRSCIPELVRFVEERSVEGQPIRARAAQLLAHAGDVERAAPHSLDTESARRARSDPTSHPVGTGEFDPFVRSCIVTVA